jgi:hypothetical protein
LSAVILHPILKIFHAKGQLLDTVVVFLLIISTLHVIFIPILAILGRVVTDTQVALTYEYVVYFGVSSKEGIWRRVDISRLLELESDPNWRSYFTGSHVETFIKKKEPQRDRTVLPPAPDINSYRSPQEIPQNPATRERVDPTDLSAKPPTRSEIPVLREGAQTFLLIFWIFYYLVNSTYLAAGLSVPHQRNLYYLFFLAAIGPVIAGVVLLLALLAFWVYVSSLG